MRSCSSKQKRENVSPNNELLYFFPESDMFEHFSAIVIYSYELHRESAFSYKGTDAANRGMISFWLASGGIDVPMDT